MNIATFSTNPDMRALKTHRSLTGKPFIPSRVKPLNDGLTLGVVSYQTNTNRKILQSITEDGVFIPLNLEKSEPVSVVSSPRKSLMSNFNTYGVEPVMATVVPHKKYQT